MGSTLNAGLPVLVVQDDVASAELERSALGSAGIHAVVARSCEHALALLMDCEFAAILLKDCMPDCDSRSIIAAAKQRGRPIPVILVLGVQSEVGAEQILQHEAADYVRTSDSFLQQLPSVVQQVTKRAQADEDARRARELLAMLSGAASEVMTVSDGAGKIVYVSAGVSPLLGYEPHELIGKQAAELIHPADRARAVVAQASAGDSTQILTSYRCRRKDGEYVWLEVMAKIRRNAENTAVAEVLGLARDITDRVRLLEQMQIVVDATVGAVLLIDQHGQVALANERAERLFGAPRGELVGTALNEVERHWLRPIAGDDDAPEPRDQAALGKQHWIALHKKGRRTRVEVVHTPIRTPQGTFTVITIEPKQAAPNPARV